ncbi:hypothetical protein [Streptomyces sp. NPDC048496]|uniref:hypothetical protein n=1 Tax=Streptomyces sp. NPDC048496 TaxID=3365558 RepID=UPI00372400E5
MDSTSAPQQPVRRPNVARLPEGCWFLCWFLIGAAIGLGIVSLLSIGPLVLAVAAAGAVALSIREAPRRGLPGVIAGPSLPLLYIAYLNRGGPGPVCTTTATEQACIDEWSPWPWVIAAVLLAATGTALFLLQTRRRHRQARATTGAPRRS